MSPVAQAVRNMVEMANKYLANEVGYLHLYYAVLETWRVVCCFSPSTAPSSRLKAYCREWLEMAERSRNEWGPSKNSLTEAEFREWVYRQMVFTPLDKEQ